MDGHSWLHCSLPGLLQQPHLWSPSLTVTCTVHVPNVPRERFLNYRSEHVSLLLQTHHWLPLPHSSSRSSSLHWGLASGPPLFCHTAFLTTVEPTVFFPSLLFCHCLCLEHIYGELHKHDLLCEAFPESQGPRSILLSTACPQQLSPALVPVISVLSSLPQGVFSSSRMEVVVDACVLLPPPRCLEELELKKTDEYEM